MAGTVTDQPDSTGGGEVLGGFGTVYGAALVDGLTAALQIGMDALRKRLQAAVALAGQVTATQRPLELAAATLGPGAAQGPLAEALRRAGSPQEGFALLFSSPAFQWRV